MSAKTYTIEVDRGEMPGMTDTSEVAAKDIGPGGALGLWDGFGRLVVRVDGAAAVILHVHRNNDGAPVLDVHRGDQPDRLVSIDLSLIQKKP